MTATFAPTDTVNYNTQDPKTNLPISKTVYIDVNQLPTTLALTVPTSAVNYGADWSLSAILTDSHNNTVVSGKNVTFTIGSSVTLAAVTDSTGSASVSAPSNLAPGSYTVGVSFANDLTYAKTSASGSVTISLRPTALTYTGSTSVTSSSALTLSAVLMDSSTGKLIGGAPITFQLIGVSGATYPAIITDATTGVASTSTSVLTLAPGSYTVQLNFFGDGSNSPSSTSATITVGSAPAAVLNYTGDTSVLYGNSLTLSARLTDNNVNALSGKSLTFSIGNKTYYPPLPTDSNGTASVPPSSGPSGLISGSYPVTVNWSSDNLSYGNASTSSVVQVNPKPTVLTYTGSGSVTYGIAPSLSATLVDNSNSPLSGKTVTFTIGNSTTPTIVTLAASTSSSGVASVWGPANLNAGSYAVNVSFANDPNYGGNTASGTLQVSQRSTVLVSSGNISVPYGSAFNLITTLADSNGIALSGRNVTFSISSATGSTTTQSVLTGGNGMASVTWPANLNAGTYAVYVNFTPSATDPNYAASVPASISVQVNQCPTSLTYTGSTIVTYGLAPPLSARLTDNNGNALSGESLTFSIGNQTYYPPPTDSNGRTSVPGPNNLTASSTAYPVTVNFIDPNANYVTATGSSTVLVQPRPTILSYVGHTSATYGSAPNLSAQLTDILGNGISDETITFTINGMPLTCTTDSTGIAKPTQDQLAQLGQPSGGSYTVIMSFAGDQNNIASTTTENVQAGRTTALSYTGDTKVTYGSAPNLSAQLTDSAGHVISGETITFWIGGQVLTAPTTTDSNGRASVLGPTNLLVFSTYYPVYANFAGDTTTNYLPSSASSTLTITQATATVKLSNLTQAYTGSPLTPTATTTPANLAIIWTGAPQTNAGSYPVTATITDPNYTGSASDTFVIDSRPAGASDAYSVLQGSQLIVNAPGVLANDSGTNNLTTPQTQTSVNGPANGTLTLKDDGSFTYTPKDGFTGTDQFTYQVFDGYLYSGDTKVTITVLGSNATLVAENDAYVTPAGANLNISAPGVLGNDNGVTGVSGINIVTGTSHGTLTFGSSNDGSFTYTSNSGYIGTDSFIYTITQGTTTSNPAMVTIAVGPTNQANNDAYPVDQNQTLTVSSRGVLQNDTGSSLSALLVTGPTYGTVSPPFALNNDGGFTYTPNQDFSGTDTFFYRTQAGSGPFSNIAMATITVRTSTALSVNSTTGTYGGSVTLSATLTANDAPLASKTISFTFNSTTVGTATTDSNGTATISGVSLSGINAGTYPNTIGASFAGDSSHTSSTGTAQLTVTPANASISVTPYSVTYDGNPHTATGTATGVKSEDLSSLLTLSGTTHTSAGDYPGDAWTFTGNGNYNSASGTVHDSIAKASATIKVTPYSVTYDGNPHTATGRATGVNGQSLSGLDLSGTTHTNAGTYATDSWIFTDTNGNYGNTSGTVSDSIAKASAAIKVTPYSVTYDGNPHTATGRATGVNGQSLSGLDLSGTTHTNAGTYATDSWIFTDSNGNYGNTSGTVSDSIAKASATIKVTPYSVTYDGNPHTATGRATGVNGQSLSGLDLSGTTHTNAGTYATDSWIFTDSNGNYGNTSGTVSDSIAKASVTIKVTPYSVTYDGNPHTATGRATGVNGQSLSGLDLSGTTHTNAGTYATDSWIFTDTNGNYGNTSGTVSDSIAKASAAIKVTPYSVTYDGNPHTATGRATGVNGQSLSGLDLSGTTHTNAGTYATDSWIFTDSNGNYGNTSGTVSDSIAKASATIKVTPYSVTYDGNPHTATGTATGVNSQSLSGLNLSGTTHTNAGTYTDSWTFTDSTCNYNNAGGTVSDSIAKATATVTLSSLTQTYTGSALTPTATTTPPGLAITWNGGPWINASTYTVTATVSDPNYTGAASGTFTISKATATVTLSNLTQTYTGSPLTPKATTSPANLAITWTGAPQTSAGSYSVIATVNDPNYAGSASGTFTIAKANQTITFGSLQNRTYGDPDFTVSASASSGLPVSFSASGNCTVSGSTVHITGAASCTITASQSGNGNYNPAPNVPPQTFTINKQGTTLKYTGDTLIANEGTANLSAVLKGNNTGLIVGGKVVFTLGTGSGAQTCNATTDSTTGTASCTISAVAQPIGTGTVSASFAGDQNNLSSSASASVQISPAATTLLYTGDTSTMYLVAPNLAAKLTDTVTGKPLTGKLVTFTVGNTTYTDYTDYSGTASVKGPANLTGTSFTVTVSFAGDKSYAASTITVTVNITARPTVLTYTGDTTKQFGFPPTLAAKLTDKLNGSALSGKQVTFVFNGTSMTTGTNSNGVATITLTVPLQLPVSSTPYTVAASYAGDPSSYSSSQTSATLKIVNSQGTVTGGGNNKSNSFQDSSTGTGSFSVQSDNHGVTGQLQYQNGSFKFYAPKMTALGISADGNAAWFAGIGDDGITTFIAYVEDNSSSGKTDVFRIWIGGALYKRKRDLDFREYPDQ